MRSAVTINPVFRKLHVSTGVELRYAQAGPGDGPALLMLHGLSDSWLSFSPILPLLPQGVFAIALTLIVRVWGVSRHFWMLGDQIRDWGIVLGGMTDLPLTERGEWERAE